MGALQRLVQRARQVDADRTLEVPSPCVSVCRVDPDTRWCEGCCRTLDEIAAWSRLDDQDKREVWRLIARRALTPGLCGGDSEEQGEKEQEERT